MGTGDDNRRHVRYPYHVDLEYRLRLPEAGETLRGSVVNLSSSGLSIFISKPLDIGQEIAIQSNLPNLAHTAVVRWIKQVGGCYKIGAECIDPG